MTQSPLAEPVPLRQRDDGTIRVADTRVTLDAVVGAFRSGATAEEIGQDYSSLKLSDIYTVIAYYLRHQAEVESYLEGRQARAAEVRRLNEMRWPNHDLRARLLARQIPIA